MKNIVQKAQSVANERGHKEVTRSDFTEAYLQISTGRPANRNIEPHEKTIVASHECGHAVQHARAYAPLQMRSALVPVVQFSSSIMSWILLAGILLINSFPQLLLIGICLFAMTTLFSFITLPVEIDASRRALVWLNNAGITNASNHGMAKDALKSAAYTYVVAALGSLATLVYYIMIYMGRREE